MEKNVVRVDSPLNLLKDGINVYIGRKQSVYNKHKDKAGLFLGKIIEDQKDGPSLFDKTVLLDSISPHAIFICGMRGSGKSYTLGVIAEEMAAKNVGAGVIIIDPMGIFWSMKSANKITQEKKNLKKWKLSPKGYKNLSVFLPKGFANEVPRDTYDHVFTIRPSEISIDEWCLTFNIDRFDTMGLLIERTIERVRRGYQTVDGKLIEGKEDDYDIQDLIDCINEEDTINSNARGFKQTTRRAMIARLNGATEWGIFDKQGTKLNDLSKRGIVTIIDVSFLGDNVRSLVVGLLARNLLNTRKKISRHEATGNLKDIFGSIPVTWLMIDEAHILVPATAQKTAASDPLIEYVRQGRQPGCSLVLATQQPAAIDSRILSQTDILICHKLVYDDDIKAVIRRMPSEMPMIFKNPHFIKNLSIGSAIIGDKQEQTSRAFLAKVRPRSSQHEGRERTSTLDIDPKVLRKNIEELVIEKYGNGEKDELPGIIEMIGHEYSLDIDFREIINDLAKKGKIDESFIEGDLPAGPEIKESDVEESDGLELHTLEESAERPAIEYLEQDADELQTKSEDISIEVQVPENPVTTLLDLEEEKGHDEEIDYSKIRMFFEKIDIRTITQIAEKKKKKKIFGSKEHLICHYLIYYPFWEVTYDYYPRKKKYVSLASYVDGITGEVIYKRKNKLARTRGMRELIRLNAEERDFLAYILDRENATLEEILEDLDLPEKKVKTHINGLRSKRLLEFKKKGTYKEIHPAFDFDILKSPIDKRLALFEFEHGEDYVENNSIVDFVISDGQAKKTVELFEHTKIWGAYPIYYPYWVAIYEDNSSKRIEVFDGITGKVDDNAREMLRYRV